MIWQKSDGIVARPPVFVHGRFIDRVYNGLLAQLYNLPLDMLIEQRLASRHTGLRFAQIETVSTLIAEADPTSPIRRCRRDFSGANR